MNIDKLLPCLYKLYSAHVKVVLNCALSLTLACTSPLSVLFLFPKHFYFRRSEKTSAHARVEGHRLHTLWTCHCCRAKK